MPKQYIHFCTCARHFEKTEQQKKRTKRLRTPDSGTDKSGEFDSEVESVTSFGKSDCFQNCRFINFRDWIPVQTNQEHSILKLDRRVLLQHRFFVICRFCIFVWVQSLGPIRAHLANVAQRCRMGVAT